MQGGGPGGSGNAVIAFGGSGVVGVGGSGLYRYGTNADPLAGPPIVTAPQLLIVVPAAGTIRSLQILISAALGAGITVAATVQINEVNSALTASIGGAGVTTASDLVNSAAVAAGQRLSINCTRTAGVPPSVIWTATFEFVSA